MKEKCTVHLYANETSRRHIPLPTTYDTVILLMLIASIIIQDSKALKSHIDCLKDATSAKIMGACKKAINIRDKQYGEITSWPLPKAVFDFIAQKFILFKPDEDNWPIQQRYNPLTLILIELSSSKDSKRQTKGYIVYDLEEARLVDNYLELQKYFIDRKRLGLVERMIITEKDVSERAKRLTIRLEIR
jgi:hypothetical protein